jgi:vitamin B12 transporter
MYRKAAACTLFLCGTLCSGISAAQEEPDGRNTLGEVVVSAGALGVESAGTVRTVGAEEIRNRGARTLDQAIALLPGVNLRTGGEGSPRIDLRGYRTRHVLLLLDGIPMNSALDMQFDPSSIPTENIEEIKLTSGGSSVLYGHGALGGVINIVTRRGSGKLHGTLAGETGDHEPYQASATLSGGNDSFSYFMSGSASKVDSFPLSGDFSATYEQPTGYRRNSDRERNSILASLGYTPTADLALGVTVNYTGGSYGRPTSAISDANDPFASPPKYVRVEDYATLSLQLAAEYAGTERLTVRGWAFLNRQDEEVSQYDDRNMNSFLVDGSFREDAESSVQGITLQPRYDLGAAGSLALSLGIERHSFDNDGTLTVVPGGAVSLLRHESLSLYSAALEYEISPLPGLGLVAGYGHYWQNRDDEDEDDYSVLAGASYDLTPQTRLKGSFKRSIRFPSLGDLYDTSKGNPFLVAERAYSYEAGVEQKLPFNSTVSLTGFYSQAKNLIQKEQLSGRNSNLADVRFSGAEAAAATRFEQLMLRASYTYLHSVDNSRAGRDGVQYNPRDKATLEAKYDFACGFTPYLSLLYVGNQYFYTKESVAVVQKAQLDNYAVVNLRLSQRLWVDRVTLYAGADNLFDRNYETSYGFPKAGRFIYGGAEVRL